MRVKRARQPSVAELLDFALYAGDRATHAVYAWLRGLELYQCAERELAESEYFRSMLQRQDGTGPRLQESERLDFAQRVAYCIASYEIEKESVLRSSSTSQDRSTAEAHYRRALQQIRKGLGPRAAEDRARIAQGLETAIRAVTGEDVPEGFKLKAGADRPVGLLIRELVAALSGAFELPRPTLTVVVRNVVAIVSEKVSEKTIQRHISAVLEHYGRTDH